jgi:hypothetical protein
MEKLKGVGGICMAAVFRNLSHLGVKGPKPKARFDAQGFTGGTHADQIYRAYSLCGIAAETWCAVTAQGRAPPIHARAS